MLIFIALLSFSPIFCIAQPNLHVAVVEYQPIANNLDGNTNEYTKIIDTFKDQNVDLIVFPEMTLTYGISQKNIMNFSTIVQENDIPCNLTTYPDFIKELSCSALAVNTYLVINTVERSECPTSDNTTDNCNKFGNYFYNTDIVFDKTGKIIAKYRKYNLFGEYQLNKPEEEHNDVTFEIEGEKFGIFTCFDILFKSPAEKLITVDKVENFISPGMWYSSLPFLTALQTQQMWSYTHNVTLFASGASNPYVGSGGTGIFFGTKGPVDLTVKSENKPGSEQTVQFPVTKPFSSPRLNYADLDKFALLQDSSINNFNSTVLVPGKETNAQLCSNEVCCNFDIVTKVPDSPKASDGDSFSYTYHLVAYSGVRSFSGVYNGGIDLCGVVACLNETLNSCGLRHKDSDGIVWPLSWTKLEISAEIQGVTNRTQYPNSVLQSLRPIHPQYTVWSREIDGDTAKISFSLTNKEMNKDFLTFAVFGRNFALDSPPDNNDHNDSGGNSSYYLVNILLLISVVVFSKLVK